MEKRWNGDDVIDLGMGNPIDPTPEQVTGKLCDVALDPKTHRYPVAGGMKNLKREIGLYYGRHYDVSLNGNDDVICTIGSKEGISHLCLALLGPGDTVLVPAPAFPIHVYAAVIAGASVLRIALDSEESFITQLTGMCKALYPGPKTRDAELSPRSDRNRRIKGVLPGNRDTCQEIQFYGHQRFCLCKDHLRRLCGAQFSRRLYKNRYFNAKTC